VKETSMTWAPRLFARSCRLSIFSRPDLFAKGMEAPPSSSHRTKSNVLMAPISLRIFASCHCLYVGCMTAVYQ
jgi:hypothetical protein